MSSDLLWVNSNDPPLHHLRFSNIISLYLRLPILLVITYRQIFFSLLGLIRPQYTDTRDFSWKRMWHKEARWERITSGRESDMKRHNKKEWQQEANRQNDCIECYKKVESKMAGYGQNSLSYNRWKKKLHWYHQKQKSADITSAELAE